jgi:hypothetical protein
MVWLVDSACLPGVDMMVSLAWFERYLYALYWAVQTSSTVGYGDLTPRNPPEVMFVTASMIIMTIGFGYFLNKIWTLFFDWNRPLTERRQQILNAKKVLLDSNPQTQLLYSSMAAADQLLCMQQRITILQSYKKQLPPLLRIQLNL